MKLFSTFLLALTISAAQAQTKMAGTYTINKTKTEFGQVPPWALPLNLKITDDKGKLTIIRHISDQNGSESDRTLAFGTGTSADYTSPSGAKNKATIQWNGDHSGLTLNNTSIDQAGNPGLAFKETWSLADDGKTLVVDRHVEQPDGLKYDIKAYYDRKD